MASRSTGGVFASEEGRAFLQNRIAAFARIAAAISTAFFISNWLIGALGGAGPIPAGPGLSSWQVVHLLGTGSLGAVWLAARGAPLKLEILRLLEGSGTVLTCGIFCLLVLYMPPVFRPDMVALLALMVLLLYRSAMIPSEALRTGLVALLSVAPVPFFTYALFARVEEPAVAKLFTLYAALWSGAAILVATATSAVIYGLQQSVSRTKRLGQYTLVEKIGEGNIGAVYRAEHALLRRPTAIKVLLPDRAGGMNWKRFEREVQMTALLTSEHTVSIYDYGRTPDGVFYYAMEYLDGIDLEALIVKEGPLPPGRVVYILGQVCAALEEAHTSGLIHRDIKPANLILCARGGRHDFVKVVDFGLAREMKSASSSALTSENAVWGTPHYMSPEAIRSAEVGAASDVYALAATAYFLLAARPVFDGSPVVVFSHHLETAPEPPSVRLGRPLPKQLETVLLRALEKDAARRPRTAKEFAQLLDACSDVKPWTEADAAAWWRERAAAIRRQPTEPLRGALRVDLAERN
jgi:eukaryotic-like serine/threonine-protein kinase